MQLGQNCHQTICAAQLLHAEHAHPHRKGSFNLKDELKPSLGGKRHFGGNLKRHFGAKAFASQEKLLPSSMQCHWLRSETIILDARTVTCTTCTPLHQILPGKSCYAVTTSCLARRNIPYHKKQLVPACVM